MVLAPLQRRRREGGGGGGGVVDILDEAEARLKEPASLLTA